MVEPRAGAPPRCVSFAAEGLVAQVNRRQVSRSQVQTGLIGNSVFPLAQAPLARGTHLPLQQATPMRILRTIPLALLPAALLAQNEPLRGIEAGDIDRSANACVDFFQFGNGK